MGHEEDDKIYNELIQKLVILSPKKIIDNRVQKIPEHQFYLDYCVTVTKKSDIDEQLIGWLKISYDYAK